MKVSLVQSGGWANVQLGCTLDTQDLRPDQVRDVEALLRSPSMSVLRSIVLPLAGPADGFQYRLEAETPTGRTVVCYNDANKPDSLRRILEIARPQFRPIPRRAADHQPFE